MYKDNKFWSDWAFTSQDLFDNLDIQQFGWTKEFYRLFKTDRSQKLLGRVFTFFIYLVILDIIENNVTFEFPLKGRAKGEFYVKSFTGEAFRKLYVAGKWEGIDFLNSNFTGYQIYFRYRTARSDWKEKPIYISHRNVRDLFYKRINEGKQYY